jgi:hypothetical protein
VQSPWRSLQLAPLCGGLVGKQLPCFASASGPNLELVLPAGSYASHEVSLPSMRMGGTLGGFANVDVMETPRFIVGPEVSWLTPESPREDLLRLRVVAPGWGVRYNFADAHVSVGVAACTRFVMFGEDMPVVDVLTSEARVEFRLP